MLGSAPGTSRGSMDEALDRLEAAFDPVALRFRDPELESCYQVKQFKATATVVIRFCFQPSSSGFAFGSKLPST